MPERVGDLQRDLAGGRIGPRFEGGDRIENAQPQPVLFSGDAEQARVLERPGQRFVEPGLVPGDLLGQVDRGEVLPEPESGVVIGGVIVYLLAWLVVPSATTQSLSPDPLPSP